MRYKFFITLAIITVFILFSMGSLHASQLKNVSFQDSFETNAGRLTARGIGLLRYMILIKAYAGVFYLPENVSSKEALSEVPKRLEIEGADFAAALFAIWLGPKSMDESLKSQLLGLK